MDVFASLIPTDAEYGKQYRPVSTSEVATDAGLSVRQLIDYQNGINNYVARVGNHKIIGVFAPYGWRSHLGTTVERVIMPFVGRWIPAGYDDVAVHMCTRRIAGAGTVAWKLYLNGYGYEGPGDFSTTYLSTTYDSLTITTSGDGYATADGTVDVVRGFEDLTWCVLTATASDITTQAELLTLDAWPYNTSAD